MKEVLREIGMIARAFGQCLKGIGLLNTIGK